MEEFVDKCKKCGGMDIEEKPSIYEDEDGDIKKNYDTLDAKCKDCGKEWIIVYI